MADEIKAAQEAPKAEDGAVKEAAKKIKVSHMSLAEVEKAMETTRKQMGGLTSRYGRSLLGRLEVLKSGGK
ncbi:MAG: hypothetical protein WCU74_09225 [Candidatus Omnitrophota bacterium]|jgi:hypothetical protein